MSVQKLSRQVPFCLCGCGKRVLWNKNSHRYNTYLLGHTKKHGPNKKKYEFKDRIRNKRVVELNVPYKFQPLYEQHRYKNYWGGRGGAKSWAFADALLIHGVNTMERILCTRELQSSIADSVHKLLSDRIVTLKLMNDYDVQKNIIRGVNGTEFLFKGLKHNIDEIKSTEGITKCWVEEAQNVSENSWKVLIPTIRKEDSEIWLSWNTGETKDATYQRFVINPPPDCVGCKVSWQDNPFFPDTLNKERLYMKNVDPDGYLHVWEGEPLSISNACIFKNKFEVDTFETPEDVRFYHGADWGFSNDPSTLVRSYIQDKKLYVDYEAYGVGVELDELPKLFSTVPTYDKWSIKADSSRPETISYLKKKHSLLVSSAKKWKGSVEDGIAYLKKFEKIIIHPRCTHTIEEMKLYSYKTDTNTNEVLPIIIDKNNHCIDALRYGLDGYIHGGASFADFLGE